MCARIESKNFCAETMDHEMWRQRALPEHMFCDSFSSPKLKLQSAKKLQEKSTTPISKLCVSLTDATLETPVWHIQPNAEHMLVDTPEKPLQMTYMETPSLTHADNHVQTPLTTPKCTPLCHKETPSPTSCETPLDTPKTSKVPSPIQTPLCVALGKPFDTRNVNSTPRRNARRSCVDKFHVTKETKLQERHSSTILKDTPLKGYSSLSGDIDVASRKKQQLPVVAVSSSENETAPSDCVNKDELCCQEENDSENTHVRKSLCISSGGSNVMHSPLDWLPASFQINKVLQDGAASEPRCSRKSDIGVYSARRLSFSSKKPGNKRKNTVPEYDPDNDIFAHGLMPIRFNIDSLKRDIGKFLNSSGPSLPHLKKSQSCGALSNIEEVSQTQQVTHVPSKSKQSKRTPSSSSKETITRTASAPDLLESLGAVTTVTTTTATTSTSSPKEASGGKIRAFLRAREIIKNIKKRAQNISSMQSCAAKPSLETESAKTNNNQNGGKLSSHIHADTQNNEPATGKRNTLKEPVINDFDDTDLPPTQPFESFILGDVTAYVEVISKNENISAGVRKELMKLGATVVPAFNRNVPVTHVVFNDGHISTYKKAKKRNIPLVSVLWIEECRKAGVKVHESLFPPYQIERYESPGTVKELKKRRIMRFYSDEKPSPRQKKGIPNSGTNAPSTETPPQKNSVRKSTRVPKWVNEVAGDNGMLRILVNMTGIGQKEFKELVNRPPTPDSETELDQDSPLPVRLLRQLAKNLPAQNNLNSESISKTNVEDASNMKTSFENSFIKKLNDAESSQEAMQTSGFKSSTVIESHSVQNECNSVSCLNHSDQQNVTQRKKIVKRKLLSPVEEIVTLPNEGDDVDSTIVENPHSCTPKRLSGENIGKKRKSNNTQIDPSKETKSETKINENNFELNADGPIRRSRRSSSYFINTKRNSPSPILHKPALVCTQLHTADVEMIVSIIDKLGTFVVEKNVTAHTTHVVTGASKRTMKILKGMARGCWIVAQEWILKSLEARKWLDEEEFELTTFSPALQKYRLERLSFGGTFKPDIFSTCGPIFVSSKSSAPRGDLVELILLCGGHTASRISKAQIAVGKHYSGIISVTALWVLDSVQYYCCKPYDYYLCS